MILPMLFAIVGFAVTTIFGAAQAQPTRVSSGGTSGYNVPIWVTQDAGLFKKYGLNTELIFLSGASAGLQAMLANEIQFANTSGIRADQCNASGNRCGDRCHVIRSHPLRICC
jgi:ABC-type nitrate/sulfonate/bicarbonate transport system substrate-binding protein